MILVNYKINNALIRARSYFNKSDLQLQNCELKNIILDLQAINIALAAERNYWQQNQELIEFAKRYDFSCKIMAQCFFKNLNSHDYYMLLNKGSNDGVMPNMVAVYKNCLLGKVATVYPQYCKLDLIISPNCKIAVYDKQTGAFGICSGQNDKHKIAVSYVSHLQKLNEGDLLISSGEGQTFPQGFGVGKISQIKSVGLYYQADAELLFDLDTINSCYLILPNQN